MRRSASPASSAIRSSASCVQRQKRLRALGTVRLAGDVVAGGAAAEREAAVATARALRDPARVVHADAQAALGEAERGGAARDAGADDRDVGPAVELVSGGGGPVPRASTDSGSATVDAVVDDDAASSSSSTRLRAISSAPRPVLRTSSSALAGRKLEQRRALALHRFRLDPERGEDVDGARERRRTELEQRVRALGERRRDLARDGEHLAALLEREVGGDKRAAALASLDDDRRRASPATIRLRAGNRQGAGSTPGAYSETMRPASATRRASSACAAG